MLAQEESAEMIDPKVFESIVLLEYAVDKSPYNYDIKLKLIALYKRLSAYAPTLEYYKDLDIKSIQHESVGWLLLSHFADCKIYSQEIDNMVSYGFKFHRISEVELDDCTYKSFMF